MRPVSRVVALRIAVLCLVAVLFSLNGLSSAQAATGSKRKLSQQSALSQHPLASMTAARRATRNAPPPLTADSWTGTAGDSNWNTSGNWSAGVPTSSDAVTIGTATANVNLSSGTGSFGTLALSNSGDVLNVQNGAILDAFGNITNTGTLNLNSIGSFTELVLEANVTLSGSGTVTLSNSVDNYIFGAATADTLTNQETIQGAGHIGNGSMTLVNSGTIDANQSTDDPGEPVAGEGRLGSTAMESFTEFENGAPNCFSCHDTKAVRHNVPVLDPARLNVSHVLSKYVISQTSQTTK